MHISSLRHASVEKGKETKTTVNRLLLCSLMLIVGPQCRASIILAISPSTQSVPLGAQASFDVGVSSLGGGTSLGTYDLNFAFDPMLLSYFNIIFGNQLDLFALGDIQSVTSGGGTVEVFELSLDSVNDLNTLQAASFRLFTLTFDTLAIGNSPVNLTVNALGDASGGSITPTLQNGSVTINAPSAVPEPNTLALLCTGLLAFMVIRRLQSRSNMLR